MQSSEEINIDSNIKTKGLRRVSSDRDRYVLSPGLLALHFMTRSTYSFQIKTHTNVNLIISSNIQCEQQITVKTEQFNSFKICTTIIFRMRFVWEELV